jgi:hypothetical protein
MVFPVYRAQAVFVSRDNHHAAGGRLDAFERELNGHSDRSDNGADNMDRARMVIWRFSDATIAAMPADDDVRIPLDGVDTLTGGPQKLDC